MTNLHAVPKVEKPLSGVMIVIIIGGGVLTFIMLFIFAKRQIMRFALRSRRGPHAPVGNDSKKSLKREIERRLDCIQKIAYEPTLVRDDSRYIVQSDSAKPPYYYRLRAVDDVKVLEQAITRNDGNARHPRDSLRAYLLTCLAAPLNGTGQRIIHQFCDMYEHARHDPSEFGKDEYDAYYRLLKKLIDVAQMLKNFSSSRKSSPSRTPLKKKTSKMPSLLDPSRLRPPPVSATITQHDSQTPNSRINLTLGVQLHQQHTVDHADLQNADEDNEILTILPYSPTFHRNDEGRV